MKGKSKRASSYFVYILECQDGTYYTGYTNDLKRRLALHNDGLASKYTRSKLPVKLVWSKPCESKSLAMKIENAIKRLKREGKKRIIQGRRLGDILR